MSERVAELAELQRTAKACRLCLEAGYFVEPPAVFSGGHTAEIMTVGQAPGITEVQAQRPFNWTSGRKLFQWLGAAGFDEDDFRQRQYMTSVTKCYPGRQPSGKGDRVPTRAEQKLCRPYLLGELRLVRPKLIIPIGGLAIKLFYPSKTRLADIIGTAQHFASVPDDPFNIKTSAKIERLPDKLGERLIVPLPHPSGASLWPNKPENKRLIERAIELLGAVRERWNL